MANIFKKPEDQSDFGKLSKEEQRQYTDNLENQLEKGDELAIILAAMKTFIPPLLLIFLIIYLITSLFT